MNQADDIQKNDDAANAEEPKGKAGKKASKKISFDFFKGKIGKIGLIAALLVFQLGAAYLLMSKVIIPQMQEPANAQVVNEAHTDDVENAPTQDAEETPMQKNQEQVPPDTSLSDKLLDPELRAEILKIQAAKPPNIDPACLYEIDDIIVNPAFSAGERFIIISLVFILENTDARRELDMKEPIVMDFLYTWLSKRGVFWYSNFDNRDILREEIRAAVNEELVEGSVTHVLYTKYVIQ